jgi:hypothetical protein
MGHRRARRSMWILSGDGHDLVQLDDVAVRVFDEGLQV